MKKINQKGFGAIEGLLAVIAVSLVFGIGFYVVNSNKDNKKTETTNSVPQKSDEKLTEQPKIEYIELKDLGVKIEKNKVTDKFTFTLIATGVSVTSNELKMLEDKNCSVEAGGVGAVNSLVKVTGTFNQEANPFSSLVKQFSNFFIISNGTANGFACTAESEALVKEVSDKRTSLASELQQELKKTSIIE